jgi:hypothetical protein
MLGGYHPSLDVRSAFADPMKIGVSERLVSDRGWHIWFPPLMPSVCTKIPPGGGERTGGIFGK